ncbi:MAG TPA: heme-binding protein [Planctomycetota bacterium]
MKILSKLGTLAAVALFAPLAAAQVTTKKVLTLDGAKAVVAAAEQFAKDKGCGGAIAIVDDGGNLLLLHRLDGTFAMGSSVSTGKARTAALFKKPTSFFEEVVVQKGRVSMTALPDFTPLKGGVPLIVGGDIVGAVGVSGAMSADQDEEMALFAAKALETPTKAPKTTYIQKEAVHAAFQQNGTLFESQGFKVNASRRDGPGEAEVHEKDTDVFYVTKGTATFVSGGKLVDAKPVQAGEVRGARLEGGESRQLVAGDVVVVPAGTPHWFQSVSGPFEYYVVKTTL